MEDLENRKINVSIGHYDGRNPIEIVLREGDAPAPVQPLETKAPIRVNISGVISTPYDWLKKRIGTIDQKKANIQVDREKMTITLVTEEADEYKKGTVKGTIEYSDVFEKFGINATEKGWEPAKLGQFLRLNRSVFENKEQCMVLVSNLKNFTAKAKAEIQKQRDPSGSMANVYRQEVESNLPKSFTVCLPIFKGTAKENIEVEFDHYVTNGEVLLQLVSPGANELAEDYRDKCIDDVLDAIRDIANDIAILEV